MNTNFMCVFLILCNSDYIYMLWDKDAVCPKTCTCRLEHLSDTAINRFIQKYQKQTEGEAGVHENNDVFYEDTFGADLFKDTTVVRTATCILQTETQPLELLEKLPKDIEALTLIQGSDSGNKTFKFSYLDEFGTLLSLELLGSNYFNRKNASHIMCEIDKPIMTLKYLNLERVQIKNSKKQQQNFFNQINNNEVTFEYVQKIDSNLHPLVMVQRGVNEEILPYKKYIEKEKKNDIPLFTGFSNLLLLRISSCELNNVHWEMFDGLHALEYLILERNNLKFIPDFAFYGTPNLKFLSLGFNNLLNIQLTDLAGLLELEYLDLSHNNFSQLSELSLPPFPKLKLANFGDNPISIIFPNTFEVMNTTDSLIVGGQDTPLTLLSNSFLGLKSLKSLSLINLNIPLLKRDLLIGMPNLNELILIGNITKIEYDTFLEVYKLQKLILSNCNIVNISMDAFIGLDKLLILDLSKNQLETLPEGVFDPLSSLKELYLNGNKFTQLPREVFFRLHVKMIRLNDNPWHCSCIMSDWKPMIVNKIKQKTIKSCDAQHDKGIGCSVENSVVIKYVYENKVAPKCLTPRKFENWSVFHVMRRQLKCPDYKPKIKKNKNSAKIEKSNENVSQFLNNTIKDDKAKLELLNKKLLKHHDDDPMKISLFSNDMSDNNEDNNLNYMYTSTNDNTQGFNEQILSNNNKNLKDKLNYHTKLRKYKKKMSI